MIKKALYFGLGAVSLTREKLEKVVDELAEKGELSHEEARQFIDDAVKKGQEEKEEMHNLIRQEIGKLRKESSMVTKSDLEALENRIKELESKLQ